MLENLDALPQSMGKQREVVEGAGDCQYLALIAAGKDKGLQLGSMLEVRVLVHVIQILNHEVGITTGSLDLCQGAWVLRSVQVFECFFGSLSPSIRCKK